MTSHGRILGIVALSLAIGCSRTPAEPPSASRLPPAYLSGRITDPHLDKIARRFVAAVEAERAGEQSVFSRVEVLPPAETILPYGLGIYQKEPRLPAIVIVGPGWAALPLADREALVARLFRDLSGALEELPQQPPLRPTLTVQTPQGLELGWINDLAPGRKLLHGDGD
jgi:hypothetical protein